MSVREMIMLRWMSGNMLRDGIRKKYMLKKLKVTPIEDKQGRIS